MIKKKTYHLFEILLSFNDDLLYKYLCDISQGIDDDILNNYCNTDLLNRKNNNNFYNTRCTNTVNMILQFFNININKFYYIKKHIYKKNTLQTYDNFNLINQY